MNAITMTDADVNAFIRGTGAQCFENNGTIESDALRGTTFQLYLILRCMPVSEQRKHKVTIYEYPFLPARYTGEEWLQQYGSEMRTYEPRTLDGWDIIGNLHDSKFEIERARKMQAHKAKG